MYTWAFLTTKDVLWPFGERQIGVLPLSKGGEFAVAPKKQFSNEVLFRGFLCFKPSESLVIPFFGNNTDKKYPSGGRNAKKNDGR